MMLRVKTLVCAMMIGAVASLYATFGHPAQQWIHFFVYLAAILLSSGMKVGLPKSEATMSVNFPFILLGILQLSPLQAVTLAVVSVVAQSRIRVIKPFTLIQILFNVSNVTVCTVLACFAYAAFLPQLHAETAPALACAATVYFLANSLPLALILGWESGTPPLKQWRQDFLWYLPFYAVGAILASTADWIGIHFGWLTSLLLIPMVYTVYRAYSGQMAIIRDRERHAAETEALHLRTIEALAMAIEAKDSNTHRHLMRVRVYVSELGKLIGLDKPQMQALLTASFLHDIGKLAVPEYIINKPGRLTPEEFEKMKIHPVVGADILERVRFPYPVVPIVRSHHEAWDGSGYPDGLKGEEIPIGARLLTAVDCLDAMASDRPYRKAIPLSQAMSFVKSRAGVQFDPAVVQLLEENYLRLEELARRQIEEMEPLRTDLFIERGAAPGAGFEPASSPHESRRQPETDARPAVAAAALNGGSQKTALSPVDVESAVFEATQMLSSALGAHIAGAALIECLRPVIVFDCVALYLRNGDLMIPQFIEGRSAHAFSMQPIPVGEGLAGWVAQSGRTILNGNPTVELSYRAESAAFTAESSALAIPLLDLNGAVSAVLTLHSAKSAAFSKEHLRILESIQSRLAHRAKAENQSLLEGALAL